MDATEDAKKGLEKSRFLEIKYEEEDGNKFGSIFSNSNDAYRELLFKILVSSMRGSSPEMMPFDNITYQNKYMVNN